MERKSGLLLKMSQYLELTVKRPSKQKHCPTSFKLNKALANSILYHYEELYPLHLKRFHLTAPSAMIQAVYLQPHEYITTGWCSMNAKDLPICICIVSAIYCIFRLIYSHDLRALL